MEGFFNQGTSENVKSVVCNIQKSMTDNARIRILSGDSKNYRFIDDLGMKHMMEKLVPQLLSLE